MRERRLGALVHTDALPGPLVLAAGFVCGSIPFSNIGARLTRGVDLRDVGTGTVSGTSLHEVAGFGPLATFGVLEVAKGSVGPFLAGRDRPVLAAAAGAASVAGHNWSPFLRGAGGRGISPATGALLANAPVGAAVLLGGMALGRLAHQTALGSFLADVALVPVVQRVHGRRGALAAAAVVTVIFAKRIAGNAPLPTENRGAVVRNRLLFDRDP
jgi:acyl phosphate:glycerol-3-phosphate acyltransferase